MKQISSFRIGLNFVCAALLAVSFASPAKPQSRVDRRKDEQSANKAIGGPGCETVRDRFSNRTKISMPERTIFRSESPREVLSLTINLNKDADSSSKAPEVELLFISKTERYKYHEQAEVNFIINGERVSGGTAYTLGALPTSPLVQEKMQLLLPVEKFLRIANGRGVEMRMGQTEITLQCADLVALRRYAVCAGLTNK